ncbi:NapC/NirT family cytochrome c [Chrysiogenes arsenatis]|uniref:NapC/NirT family cytochrome c n=1 Tax=Chrysiogenes arsenatis TaxID=309797 RepID=UPI0004201993|nr:NapC/NirT family cytochrome c [Chrysiogenes arsenatis]
MKNLSAKAWAVIIVIVAIVGVGGSVGAIKYTSTSGFCVLCHDYEKSSWQAGGHPEVGCITCHTKGLIMDKMVGMKKVVLTASGKVDPHHDKLSNNPKVTAKNCMGCHFDSKKADPTFLAKHQEYMQNVESCTACHGNLGHKQSIWSQKLTAKK